MTQPPDERPRPDQPAGEGGPENEPTVAWTPPEPDPATPADQGGVGYAAIPDEGEAPPAEPAPAPPAPNMPTEPPAAPPDPGSAAPSPDTSPPADQTDATTPVATPPAAGPIISAAPTEPTSGWQTPTAATPPPAVAGSGWEIPTAAAGVATTQDGYVISGVGSRFVAWLIDGTVVGIVPSLLFFVLFDWSGTFQQVFDQLRLDPTGRTIAPAQLTPPAITLNFILVTLIGLGIQYLYFVGFWTSRWRATPGMAGLKMRVVDAMSGGELSLVQATKRWIAMGWPIALLSLVPGLSASAGLIQFAFYIFLFFTTVTNERRQGIHDRWADSLVIRHQSSGTGATVVGCLVFGAIAILLAFVFSAVFVGAMAPYLQDYINSLPSPAP